MPYDDLRYLFGEIMYGGHITDDWDRRLCRTYLEEFIRPEMLEGELSLAPGFPLPGNMDYSGYHQVRYCCVYSSVVVSWGTGRLSIPPVCPAQRSLHMLTLEQDWGQKRMTRRAEHILTLLSAPSLLCSTQEAQDFQPQVKEKLSMGIFVSLVFGSTILFVNLFYK